MSEIKYEIIKKIGVLSKSASTMLSIGFSIQIITSSPTPQSPSAISPTPSRAR